MPKRKVAPKRAAFSMHTRSAPTHLLCTVTFVMAPLVLK
jgi:hypothetical protein